MSCPLSVTSLLSHRGRRFRKARYRDVSFDPSAFVQTLGVNKPAHGHIDIVRADPVEERARIPTLDVELDKTGLVEKRDVLGSVTALLTATTAKACLCS